MAYGPCTPEQQAGCPLMQHFSDTHHEYYPRYRYQTQTERAFRELPEHKTQICRYEHEEIHATQPMPNKPPIEEMQTALGWLATGVA